MGDLKFGLHLSCQSPEGGWDEIYEASVRQAALAEELGYHSIYVAEHHFMEDGWIPVPTILLGGVAAVTDDIKIGTDIVILPLHNPVRVAEEAIVLDLMSQGNFRLGVAIGWRDEEFKGYDILKRERVKRVEEGIELIRGLTERENVTYSGDIFSVENLTVMPRPIQDSIPIWYGGQSKPAIERAAHMADAWIMSPIESKSELVEKLPTYKSALNEAGRDYDDVNKPLRREVYIAEDEETAWEEVGDALLYEYGTSYGDFPLHDVKNLKSTEREKAIEELKEHSEDRFIIGGPESLISELESYQRELDIDEILMRVHFPGLSPNLAEKCIQIIADEVMSEF